MAIPLSCVRSLARRHGTLRSKELVAAGIARTHISRMVAAGQLVRVARGLYALPDDKPSGQQGLAIVTKRVPKAVFCLLTALRLHELTTTAAFEVWIAIGNKERAPRLDWPPLRVVRYSGAALHSGVEKRKVDGVSLNVTSVAKTVADCFKFRSVVGLDVAREALRDALRDQRTTVDELWKFAKICRVTNIMRPYLEALV